MSTQRALVVQHLGVAKVMPNHGIAPLRPDSILVKVKAVAVNPTDWKALNRPTNGCVIGVDYAGIVEDVGEGPVTREWKRGNRVAGSLHGSNASEPSDGTFAEWVSGSLC